MADNKERLIDKDMESPPEAAPAPSSPVWLAVKISVGLGLLSGIIVTFVVVFGQIGETEEKQKALDERFTEIENRQKILAKSVNQLNEINQTLAGEIRSLDLTAAKGDLRSALTILNTVSENQDKQLAVSRNGLISLARMVKGSRVWQDDYRAQFQELFQHNQQVKDEIKQLRGLAAPKKDNSRYIEIDF